MGVLAALGSIFGILSFCLNAAKFVMEQLSTLPDTFGHVADFFGRQIPNQLPAEIVTLCVSFLGIQIATKIVGGR